jgi:hypothetical protein
LLVYAAGLRLSMRSRAERIAAAALGRAPAGTFPSPWSPFRWISVFEEGDARIVVPVDVAKRTVGEARRFEAPAPGDVADALRAAGAILGRDGRWTLDLRYAYPWPVPVAGVERDAEGRVLRLRLP